MKNLSIKELNYIKDFMSWELLMAKKCNQYAYQEMEAHFKGVYHQTGQIHQQNYLDLLNYIEQVSNTQGGMMQ